jgi:hypothetical protein
MQFTPYFPDNQDCFMQPYYHNSLFLAIPNWARGRQLTLQVVSHEFGLRFHLWTKDAVTELVSVEGLNQEVMENNDKWILSERCLQRGKKQSLPVCLPLFSGHLVWHMTCGRHSGLCGMNETDCGIEKET